MQKGTVVGDTLEKLKDLAKDSSKAVASEPLEILKQALGQDSSGGQSSESPEQLEQGASANPQNQTSSPKTGASDQQMVNRKLEDRDRVQQLLSLHRQRLKEEESYFEQSEAQEKQAKEADEQEKKQEEQAEIIQLQRQEAKDTVLAAPSTAKGPGIPGAVKQAQKLTGTKEVGKSSAD